MPTLCQELQPTKTIFGLQIKELTHIKKILKIIGKGRTTKYVLND